MGGLHFDITPGVSCIAYHIHIVHTIVIPVPVRALKVSHDLCVPERARKCCIPYQIVQLILHLDVVWCYTSIHLDKPKAK